MTEPAQAQATETAEAAATADTGDPIFDALAALPDEPAEVPTGDEPTDPGTPDAKKDEAEKEKKPEPGKPKKGRELEEFLLAPEQLKSPEGIGKAADFLSRKRSKLDAIEIRTNEKAAKTEQERKAAQDWFTEENAKLEDARGKARYVNQILDTLETGELPQVLDMLGRLRKRSGVEVWEGLAKLAISGKRPEKNVELEALRAELADTRRALLEREEAKDAERAAREEQAEVERLKPLVAEREAAVLKEAADAAKYPTIAEHLKLDYWRKPVLNEVAKQRRSAREKGQTLDLSSALGIIEKALAEKAGRPAGATPAAPASETHAARQTAMVTSIAPSLARSAPTVRDKTEAELAEDLARDTPALERILGISLG